METNEITITKYSNLKSSTLGAFEYYHHIKFKKDGYSYGITMTDECRWNLMEQLEKTGNKVIFRKE